MTEFEKAVVEEVKRVRAILQRNEELRSFNFTIEASGRVHDGEVSIKFGIGEYGANVTSYNIDAAVREFMRRKGYESENEMLLISGSGDVVEY